SPRRFSRNLPSLRMRSCTWRPVFDFFPGVLPRKRSRRLCLRGLAVLACLPPLAALPAPPPLPLPPRPPPPLPPLPAPAPPLPLPAPSNTTLIWLGTTRIPKALHRFCTARLVRRVAGMHLNSTLGTQVMWRDGPMTDGDTN